MKRAVTNQSMSFPSGSIRKVFTRSQLAGVGAVVLAWNHLELNLNHALARSIALQDLIEADVVGRIHGIDGKIAIIRSAIGDNHLCVSKPITKLIESTLSAVGECKTYRDAVAHARAVYHKPAWIAETTGGRGKTFDLLFTPEALDLLAKRIEAVSDEVSEIAAIFNLRSAQMSIWEYNSGHAAADRETRSLGQDILRYAAQLRIHRRRRLSLPPLPQFPAQAPTRKE